MSFKGINVRQSVDRLFIRISLKDASGVKVTLGTTLLSIYECRADGLFNTYDFSTGLFTAGAVGTFQGAMQHRRVSNGTIDTGIWTTIIGPPLTGFTVGNIYITQIVNGNAFPNYQEREFQFGSEEGDFPIIPGLGLSVVSPVLQSSVLTIVQGDDYNAGDGRALVWNGATSNVWPDLTNATIALNINDSQLIVAGSVITPTGMQSVQAQPTAAQTSTLPPGKYGYTVTATLQTTLRQVTLVAGQCIVLDSERIVQP